MKISKILLYLFTLCILTVNMKVMAADTAQSIDKDKSWQEITEDIRANHPSADGLLQAYCDEIQRSRSHVIAKGLVTVPANEEVRCLDTPPSQRAFSPFGTFRQPPPFSDSKVGYLILHPIDPELSAERTEKMLRAHDRVAIAKRGLW